MCTVSLCQMICPQHSCLYSPLYRNMGIISCQRRCSTINPAPLVGRPVMLKHSPAEKHKPLISFIPVLSLNRKHWQCETISKLVSCHHFRSIKRVALTYILCLSAMCRRSKRQLHAFNRYNISTHQNHSDTLVTLLQLPRHRCSFHYIKPRLSCSLKHSPKHSPNPYLVQSLSRPLSCPKSAHSIITIMLTGTTCQPSIKHSSRLPGSRLMMSLTGSTS